MERVPEVPADVLDVDTGNPLYLRLLRTSRRNSGALQRRLAQTDEFAVAEKPADPD